MKKMEQKKLTGLKGRRWIRAALAALLVLGTLGGTAYGHYVQSRERTATVSARNFYFTSDYLRDTGEPMKIYKLNAPVSPAETTSVTITLHNFVDALRVSDMDTRYTVSVTGSDVSAVQVKDGLGNVLPDASGTIDHEETKEAVITIDGLAAGQTYLVTVTGEGGKEGERQGYLETLQATFEVAPKDAEVYLYVDDSDPENNCVILTVWTENVTGSAQITVPEYLIPDNTDPVMAAVKTGQGSFTDAVSFAEAYASHSYRFFKAPGAGDYDEESFDTVTVGAVTAVAGTP